MANHPVGSQAPCSGDGSEDAPIVVVVGAGSEPTTAVREALALRDVVDALAIALRQKGIVAPPNRDRVLVVDAPARRQAAEPWWERLGIGIMAMLLLVGSVLLPSGRSAQAEATLGEPIPIALNPFGVEVNPATNRIYAVNLGIDGQGHGSDGTVTVIDGATNAVIGTPITVGMQPATVGVNPNTGRIYTANLASLTVSVIGTPFSIAPNMASSGSTATATWSSLFAPNGSDFVGLFEPGAPNTSPLNRRYTNGTATTGGAGASAGSVELPIPTGLANGRSYEVRLVSGSTGGIFARIGDTVPSAANDSYTMGATGTLNEPAPGVLANDPDAESAALLATVVTNPAHGTLALQPNGAFSYTPSFTFSGVDSFTYRATDQSGLPSTATATITVPVVACVPRPAHPVGAGRWRRQAAGARRGHTAQHPAERSAQPATLRAIPEREGHPERSADRRWPDVHRAAEHQRDRLHGRTGDAGPGHDGAADRGGRLRRVANLCRRG